MASQHLPSTFPEKVDLYAVALGGSRVLSDRCAYLFGMTRFSISARCPENVAHGTGLLRYPEETTPARLKGTTP